MKTLFKSATLVVAALAMVFVSCSKSDTTPDGIEKGDDKNVKEVNANFVFNVSTSNTPGTKMNAANVQATTAEQFRGIDNAMLYAFKLGTTKDGKHVSAFTAASPITADKNYSLGTVLTAGYLNPGGDPKSRRVIELSLPTEANALVFYGKAIKNGTDAAQGKISANYDKNFNNIAFSLSPRVENNTTAANGITAWAQYEAILAKIMNEVSQAMWTPTAGGQTLTVGSESQTFTAPVNWSDYAKVEGSPLALKVKDKDPINGTSDMCANGEMLSEAFVSMNMIYDGALRAGSSPAVLRVLIDLYSVVHNIVEATPTTLADELARQVAMAVQNAISKYLDGGNAWDPIETIKTNSGISELGLVGNDAAFRGFPGTVFFMPLGAAQLQNTLSATAPVVTWSYPASPARLPSSGVALANYTYPAELCYFGNSPIRVSNTAHVTADYPDGTSNWDTDGNWTTDWAKSGHVLSTTRSVAMQNNIQYGTALLKSTVRYGAAVLKDNNAAIQLARTGAVEQDKEIPASAGAFTFVGVLVGGMDNQVGWNYLPKNNSFNYVIYDNVIPNTAIPAYVSGDEKSAANYTLVWDNYSGSETGDEADVYVALEFKNNTGMDFWGDKNVIRKEGTFYIVGKLKPTDGGTITWPTNFALPPYAAADGTALNKKRIFIQDFVTEANFVIGVDALKSAYSTLPDLRSTQISLGLSVDLAWTTGLTFTDVPLGE